MGALKQGHNKASTAEDDAERIKRLYEKPPKGLLSDQQQELLKDIPTHKIRRAWFTLAHLLLNDNALVGVMGCSAGEMTYAMSVLKPNLQFVGIDHRKDRIEKARKNFKRPNLEFRQGNIADINLGPESLDAVINSRVLYEIYSNHAYSDLRVTQALDHHFSLLKTHGLMFIQDYVMPPPGQYIMMEFPDKPSLSDDFEEFNNSELLEWYSEEARSHDEYAGFFLEELPQRFPKTRLYRVPYKWAYEFMVRKHDRELWKQELDKEYAFFTERDYRKNLKALGGRVIYTAKQWDQKFIEENYQGQFNLYNEDGSPLDYPPTSIGVLAKKINHSQSLKLSERRRSKKPKGDLQITTMRNQNDGELIDVVARAEAAADVLPYRLTDNGKSLKIYLHEGNPRGLANAVPRGTNNLDGRYWSGHMIEAISVGANEIPNEFTQDSSKKFAEHYLDMKTFSGAKIEKGAGYYPDPRHIDEKIDTFFLEVSDQNKKTLAVSHNLMDSDNYKTRGVIREFDAQDVLDAISVGLIPTCRLELQISMLMEKFKIKKTNWNESPLQIQENPNLKEIKIDDLISRLRENQDTPFEKAKGKAGQIQLNHSVFVDEGLADAGGSSGISSHEMDFYLPSNQTNNIAVVLPLSRNINGEVMAGVVTEFMPVPQRYKGSGLTVSCPSFEMPSNIKSMEEAKRFIADKFEVDPKYVCPMGPSYFKHIGITPQRVFPFAVSEGPGSVDDIYGATGYLMIEGLKDLCYWDNHDSFIQVVAMSYELFGQDSDLSVNWSLSKSFADERSKSTAEMGEYMHRGASAAAIPAPSEGSSSSKKKSSSVSLSATNTDTPPPNKKKTGRSAMLDQLKGRVGDIDSIAQSIKPSEAEIKAKRKEKNGMAERLKRHID